MDCLRTYGLPSQRLRVRDVRRSELLTRYGEMPPCVAMAPGDLAREELRGAISSVVARLRASGRGRSVRSVSAQ